jgi:hypothetical protein
MACRLEHITVADRITLGCTCLLGAGQYGLITHLAQELGTSRQFLYTLRARTRTAVATALAPGTPGRPPVETRLVVDDQQIARTILVLSQVAHASVRGIQESLRDILHVERSLGFIEAVLQEAAARAAALLPVPTRPVQAEADEVFAAGRPVLEVVDRASGAILALVPTSSRDETAWGCTLVDLAARGVTVGSLTADGADGLRAGVAAAGLPAPWPDHWHTLRDLGRVAQWLEHEAYRRLEAADRSQRAAAAEAYCQQHQRRPRRGRPLRAATDPASVQAAVAAAAGAVRRADGATYLLAVVREALRPLDPATGQVRRPAAVRADLLAAAALLGELGGRAEDAARLLDRRADGLVAALTALEAALAGPRAVVGEAGVAFLTWAWQHRVALCLREAADAWPQEATVAGWVWAALAQTGRTSSTAENLNSVLAFHRATHRGLPAPVVAVLTVYRNHRVFPRGTRAGHSPLDLLDQPSPHWLDALGYGHSRATAGPDLPAHRAQTVNTLAA